MMTTFQIEAAKLSLKNMMAKGHMNICVIDQILKMTGGIPNKEEYESLRLLHCVDFKDMPQSLRMELPGVMKRVLESPSMELKIEFVAPTRFAEMQIAGN